MCVYIYIYIYMYIHAMPIINTTGIVASHGQSEPADLFEDISQACLQTRSRPTIL